VTIFDMPDEAFRTGDLFPVRVQQVNRSGYTRKRKVMSNAWHTYWRLENAEHVQVVGEANIRPWRAFFADLEGVKNHFRYPAVAEAQHSGAVTAITVSSSGTTNLVIGNLPASVTYLPKASRLTVRLAGGLEQLIELRAALVTTAGGQASASFFPPLRAAPVVGQPVETKWPWVVLANEDPDQKIPASAGGVYNFSINASEEW
jgi:hypothetical protein